MHTLLAIVGLAKVKQLATKIKHNHGNSWVVISFKSLTINWPSYVDQLKYYFIANEITENKKVTVLLSACGSDTFKTICSLVDTEAMKDIAYDDLIKRLSEHCDPVPSCVV